MLRYAEKFWSIALDFLKVDIEKAHQESGVRLVRIEFSESTYTVELLLMVSRNDKYRFMRIKEFYSTILAETPETAKSSDMTINVCGVTGRVTSEWNG